MKKFLTTLTLLLSIASVFPLTAAITLPGVFSDNMVLQRECAAPIWGKTSPEASVSIMTSWDGHKYKTRADKDGNWQVAVHTPVAGGPYEISFSENGKQQFTLHNVLIGEVWICSGQSNMEMPVRGYRNQPIDGALEAIIDSKNHPQLRLFNVPRVSLSAPADNCEGDWLVANPESVGQFSATAYFFGHLLNSILDIPVGLINTSWQASNIQAWIRDCVTDTIAGIDTAVVKKNGEPHQTHERIFNGMIAPLVPFAARGFIWYQGESNRDRHWEYAPLLSAMIRDWRSLWGNDRMPFYMVQLAPYCYEGDDLKCLPLMIEAQQQVVNQTPYTGMAGTSNAGKHWLIHPAKKREVGERLAFLALANEYDVKGLPAPAPSYKSMTIDGNKAILTFNNIDTAATLYAGNTFSSDKRFNGFEIAGENQTFFPAKARYNSIQGTVTVWSDSVSEPVAVRYYFRNFDSEADVETTLGQPLIPFRTDRWDIPREAIIPTSKK